VAAPVAVLAAAAAVVASAPAETLAAAAHQVALAAAVAVAEAEGPAAVVEPVATVAVWGHPRCLSAVTILGPQIFLSRRLSQPSSQWPFRC
jgi:hypothetical protein